MRLPFVSRRELDTVTADRQRIRAERDQFAGDRDAALAAAKTAARQLLPPADEAQRKALADALGAEQHLTWNQLLVTARRTREALAEAKAEAVEEKKRADHLETGSETGRLKRRVAHLERQLDDATSAGDVGVPAGADWRRRPESGA